MLVLKTTEKRASEYAAYGPHAFAIVVVGGLFDDWKTRLVCVFCAISRHLKQSPPFLLASLTTTSTILHRTKSLMVFSPDRLSDRDLRLILHGSTSETKGWNKAKLLS